MAEQLASDIEPDDKACGEDCSGTCPPGEPLAKLGSLSIYFPLGRASDGKTAGYFRLRGPSLGPRLGSALSVQVNKAQSVGGPFPGVDQDLRQYVTGFIVAEIVRGAESGAPAFARTSTLRFWHAGDMQFNGQRFVAVGGHAPFTTTTISYLQGLVPDPRSQQMVAGATLQLVTTGAGAGTKQYVNVGGDWTLRTGLDAATQAFLKTESLLVDVDPATHAVTQTRLISSSTGAVASRQVEVRQPFAWGSEVVQHRTSAPGSELIEQRSYYDTVLITDPNYGKLKQLTSPTGYWERYEYGSGGRVAKVISQFKDGAYTEANPSL
jgi:hypothetical protein